MTIYTSGERKKENLSDFLAYLSKRHKTSDGRRYTQNGRNLTSGILQETRRTSTAFLKRITIRNHYFHARRIFPASAILALQPISAGKPASDLVLRGKPRDTFCWSGHNVSIWGAKPRDPWTGGADHVSSAVRCTTASDVGFVGRTEILSCVYKTSRVFVARLRRFPEAASPSLFRSSTRTPARYYSLLVLYNWDVCYVFATSATIQLVNQLECQK